MFEFLYELLCGQNPDPIFATDIYPFVGLFTLVFAFVFTLVFYIILGRSRPIWDKTVHWVITMIILLIIAFGFAYNHAQTVTEEEENSFFYTFAMVNTLYAFIYYILFSILLKRFSIFAKRTPF
ncbi:hypothetical protein ACFP1I_13410 [Dyadobacter subterraneus]|jgi:glucose uptake protein GlcU|uniref:Transmembrane protein n=1 Tax=Dyadobacter subterraneus TaxID=2773304 RepID=A0ABR9WCY3_9BACT|nr:hypothetical protein [Dyadobacter subterraneus]MBE9462231.1 hypothetical protein [Dyadobacter subterraneus]